MPTTLVVLGVTVEPRAEIPLHPHPGLEISLVETGGGTIRTAEGASVQVVRGAGGVAATPAAGPGEEVTLAAGDAAIFPVGNVSAARAGDEGATILVFEFAPLADAGMPAATPAA